MTQIQQIEIKEVLPCFVCECDIDILYQCTSESTVRKNEIVFNGKYFNKVGYICYDCILDKKISKLIYYIENNG